VSEQFLQMKYSYVFRYMYLVQLAKITKLTNKCFKICISGYIRWYREYFTGLFSLPQQS